MRGWRGRARSGRATRAHTTPRYPEAVTGQLRELHPGVHALRVPMHPGGLPYSLCYLIEDADGRIHIVDPGTAGSDNLAALDAALRSIGHGMHSVASVIATHLHPDHLGLAFEVSAASGAPIVLHERERDALLAPPAPARDPAAQVEAWGVPEQRRPELLAAAARPSAAATLPDGAADRIAGVRDGDILAIPGRSIRVLWTPGHTAGHLCLDDAGLGMLYTGDHVLPTVNPGIGLGPGFTRNPIADYLDSLERVAALGEREVAPGHEDVFTGLAERCAELSRHQLRRTQEVAAGLASGTAAAEEQTVWELARTLTWTSGWDGLSGFTLLSALTQTGMHAAFARSSEGRDHLRRS